MFWSCFDLHMAYNCNLRSRSGFHATKIVRNDISHLIIGLPVKIYFCFKISAGGHLGFLPFFCQTRHRIYVKFSESDIWLFGDNLANFQLRHPNFYPTLSIYFDFIWVDGGHFEFSVIIKSDQMCQSGILAHINRDISCINNPQKKFAYTHLQGSTLGNLNIK